jgi:hypothetical protein
MSRISPVARLLPFMNRSCAWQWPAIAIVAVLLAYWMIA